MNPVSAILRRPKFSLIAVLVLPLALLLATPAAQGQTTWLGSSGTDWTNASNWDNGVPNATTIAVNNNTGPNEPLINGTNQTAGGLAVGTDSNSDFSTLVTVAGGGSLVVSGNVQVGFGTGSTGQIDLEEGATLQTTAAGQTNIIGVGGNGTLNISFSTFNGTGQPLTVGQQAGTTGTVSVSDSSNLMAGLTMVGDGGTGSIAIANNSQGNFTSSLILGNQTGGNGNVTANGFISNFTVAAGGNLVVGLAGNGNFTANNNARINIAQNTTIAQSAGSTGTVLVTDQFTTMNVTATLNVGYGGAGNLTIANNGNVTVSGNTTIGFLSGANGTALVTGSGSVLNAGTNLDIGNSGNGTLTIASNGQVNASQVAVGNHGAINLNSGGVLAASGLTATGAAALSFNGGTLTATANNTALVANFTAGQVTPPPMELRLMTAASRLPSTRPLAAAAT